MQTFGSKDLQKISGGTNLESKKEKKNRERKESKTEEKIKKSKEQ